MATAPNRAKVRSQPPNTHSQIGLATVVRDTARLWRKHRLGYDQTKYVVEHMRRDLGLLAPRERKATKENWRRSISLTSAESGLGLAGTLLVRIGQATHPLFTADPADPA